MPGWLLPGKSVAQQFHEHQRLIDGAHAHLLGDGVPEALVGGGGVWGHGAIVAAPERLDQVCLWAARQAGTPAGIPSGVIALRLQPTRLRVWLCRPSPSPTPLQHAVAAPLAAELRSSATTEAASGCCSSSARGVVPIALGGDAVQNGSMAAPSNQANSLSRRLQAAREEVLAVAHRHGARNLRIYGSVARGQDRLGSDLDLLVDLERGCSLLEVIALRQELEALLNCQVDLAEAAQLHPLIRDQVIAQATAL